MVSAASANIIPVNNMQTTQEKVSTNLPFRFRRLNRRWSKSRNHHCNFSSKISRSLGTFLWAKSCYIIREVASLPEPKPYLLLLGQKDKESSDVINFGIKLLGSDNFQVRTVPQKEVSNYYKIADAFVLSFLTRRITESTCRSNVLWSSLSRPWLWSNAICIRKIWIFC